MCVPSSFPLRKGMFPGPLLTKTERDGYGESSDSPWHLAVCRRALGTSSHAGLASLSGLSATSIQPATFCSLACVRVAAFIDSCHQWGRILSFIMDLACGAHRNRWRPDGSESWNSAVTFRELNAINHPFWGGQDRLQTFWRILWELWMLLMWSHTQTCMHTQHIHTHFLHAILGGSG